MRRSESLAAVLTILLLGTSARAGEFVRNQDLHFIHEFGAISVVDGRLVIGKSGRGNCVPLATQLRVENGPYISYDPDAKMPAVLPSREVNLKAEWDYVIRVVGREPKLSDYKGAREKQSMVRTTEVRVQAKNGKYAGWYLGVDRVAIKTDEEARQKQPDTSEAAPLPTWPLVLVKDQSDALIFARRETWTYSSAK